jgi:TonB family protein
MKKLASILSIALLVGCASTGPNHSGTTAIDFNSHPGPIVKVTPMYPEAALSQDKQGSVTMSFIVGEDGKATEIQVLESVGEPLESAAIQALQKALYHSKFSGKSVTVVAEFTLNK